MENINFEVDFKVVFRRKKSEFFWHFNTKSIQIIPVLGVNFIPVEGVKGFLNKIKSIKNGCFYGTFSWLFWGLYWTRTHEIDSHTQFFVWDYIKNKGKLIYPKPIKKSNE